MNLVKHSAVVGAAGLLTGLVLVATGTPAVAVPANCTADIVGSGKASSLCTTGTGQHRVVVEWRFVNPWLPPDVYTSFGNWAAVGTTSTATFAGGSTIFGIGVQLR